MIWQTTGLVGGTLILKKNDRKFFSLVKGPCFMFFLNFDT